MTTIKQLLRDEKVVERIANTLYFMGDNIVTTMDEAQKITKAALSELEKIIDERGIK